MGRGDGSNYGITVWRDHQGWHCHVIEFDATYSDRDDPAKAMAKAATQIKRDQINRRKYK